MSVNQHYRSRLKTPDHIAVHIETIEIKSQMHCAIFVLLNNYWMRLINFIFVILNKKKKSSLIVCDNKNATRL